MTEEKNYYDSYWGNGVAGWIPHSSGEDCVRKRLIQGIMRDGCRILDVGCGDGRFATCLKDYRVDYHGIDLSESAVNKCTEKGIKASVHDLQDALPFPENSFDVVCIFEVFEHLFLPSKCLEEITRVLSPNGCIIGSVPNTVFLPNRIMFMGGKFNAGGSPATSLKKPWEDPHIRFFTKSSLRKMISSYGKYKVKIMGGPFSLGNFPVIYKRPALARIFSIISLPVAFLGIVAPNLFSSKLYFKASKK